jgi:hypothetical protein
MPWVLPILGALAAPIASADKRARMPVFGLAVVVQILVPANRQKTGYEFDSYVDSYRETESRSPPQCVEGWHLVNGLLHLLFGLAQSLFFLTSIVIYRLIAWVLYREPEHGAFDILTFLLNVSSTRRCTRK